MALQESDNFTRSNEDLGDTGSLWTEFVGGSGSRAQLVSNQLDGYTADSSGKCSMTGIDPTLITDADEEVRIKLSNNVGFCGVALRAVQYSTDDTNAYFYFLKGGTAYIYKRNAGGWSAMASSSITASGSTLYDCTCKAIANGANVDLTFIFDVGGANEVTVSHTDTSSVLTAKGTLGVGCGTGYSSYAFLADNFEYYDTSGGGTTIDSDQPMAIDWSADVRADSGMPLDFLTALSSDNSLPVAWSLPVSADGATPIEHRSVIQSDSSIPVGASGGVDSDQLTPIEWSGALVVNADAQMPIDWSASIQSDQGIPADHIQTIVTDQAVPVAFDIGVVADQAAALEWLASIGVDKQMLIEWRGAVTINSDQIIPIEWDGDGPAFISGVDVWRLDARGTLWRLPARAAVWKLKKH
ncbi:MAG: hypothetical protein DIZ78_09395 [endosymbiont of Escarpia spicata]|uniref:Uncharacterized protein n=1 Tax=endosymbiont of Escarpia spicata TaxID=2200908 RepID=A0A370DPR2_9GAMM|nr:MAG: hypothetical protein DIZ78_09395 [endosymbiont of Escarpia spicata]